MTRRTAIIISVAWSVVVYVPSLGNGFALDDTGDIVENSVVHGLANTGEILTSPYRSRVPPGRSPYRPLTSLTYALDWSLGSGSPLPFHVFNVALHAVNTALVTLLLTALGATSGLALLGGSIFAVHPVHVEAIANSVGRGDALMALFVLLGTLAYVSRFRSQWAHVGLVSLAYGLALASKENGIVLPALLILLSWLFAGKSARTDPHAGTRMQQTVPTLSGQFPLFSALAAVLVLYLMARYQVLGTIFHRDAAPYIVPLPTSLRLSTAVANVTELARLLLVPADLVADYGPEVILPAGVGSLRFWVGGGVVLVAATGAIASLRHSPWIACGVTWCALSLAVLGNVFFPVGVWVAERTLYLPSVGVSMVAIGLGLYAAEALPGSSPRLRWGAVGAASLLVAMGGARTWARSPAWSDTDTVFMTLAEEHPEAYRAQWWMGMRLIDQGQQDGGVEWLRRAVAASPNDLGLQLDLVRGLLLAGSSQEALGLVSSLPPADPARDVYLTQSHIQLGQPERARVAVQEGLSRFPQDARLMRLARELAAQPR